MSLILHLEDDEALSEIFKFGISATDANIEIKQFVNSDEAIRYIENNLDKIDLFLLDIRVPGETDGVGVAEKIRELGSKRPVILSSAFRKPETHLLERLNCRWMAKPWHVLDSHRTILPLLKS